ncbi:YibE/F family protein [Nocardioides nanhaiensis]|uniref:YibE/F family protein n=1 Tax=Nocardioides nanhaiensis TaxID=1476871 RepID=UPI0031E8FFF1
MARRGARASHRAHRAGTPAAGAAVGHGHGHGHGGHAELEIDPLPRTLLLAALAVVGVVSLVGAVLLWPSGSAADELQGSVGFAAEGSSFPEGVVEEVQTPCPVQPASEGPGGSPTRGEDCGNLVVTVDEGVDEGREVVVPVAPQVSQAGLEPGDRVELLRAPAPEGGEASITFFGIERSASLWWAAGLFVLVVLMVARFRGLMALVGLGFAGLVVGYFLLPALLAGEPAVPVALVASTVIMFVVIYTTHGVSMRTSAALGGTLAGVLLTALLAWWAVGSARLTGVSDDGSTVLSSYADRLDLQSLLMAAVVIAGLGILNDVTITQASAVWELRAASASLTRAQLFASGMRIGRDHIASTIYTIVFAYTGTALTLLLAVSLYDRSIWGLLETEELASEIVRSLAGSIGLVLAVPATTAVAVLTVPAPRERVGYETASDPA